MRPGQQNKRMRGRNRRGPSPLSRSYESNGPDVKIRGTASHIAEKYMQLARDAQSSGDPVAAENYFQHAEHYFRIIAAAQGANQGAQQGQQQQNPSDQQPRQQRANGSEEAAPEAAEAAVQPRLDTPQPSVDDVQPTIPAPAGTEEQPSIDLTVERPQAATESGAESGGAGSDMSAGNGAGTNGSQAPRRRRRRPAPAGGAETASAAPETPASDAPATAAREPDAAAGEPAPEATQAAPAEQTDAPPKRTRRPRVSKAANGAGEKDAGKAAEPGEGLFPATEG